MPGYGEKNMEPTVETSPLGDCLALGITDAARVAGVGRSTNYEEINAGRLKARKAGRRTLIARADLQAWLDALPNRAPSQTREAA